MAKKKPQINIAYLYKKFKISSKLIEDIFSRILKLEKFPLNLIIDIAFTDNKQIKALNKKYRGKNKPTDVLSFCLMDDDDIRAGGRSPLLGEIIISVPYAKCQAKEKKHSLQNEIIFLLIHGLLHLLGYDDETEKDYALIMKKQNKYFTPLADKGFPRPLTIKKE